MKATPGLSSEKSGIHHLSQERATAKFGIVVGAVEHVERVHHRIEPDEVGGLERPHLVAKTLLEYCVDLHRGRETILKYEGGLVHEQVRNPVGDKAWQIADHDGLLIQSGKQLL